MNPDRDLTRPHRRPPPRVLAALVALVVMLGGFVAGTPAAAKTVLATPCVSGTRTPSPRSATPPTASIPGAGQGATVTGLNMAMVQLAVYDAVNSIVGGHEPFLSGLPEAMEWASVDAAVATAAHDVLVGLGRPPVPALPVPVRGWLTDRYTATLGTIADGAAKEEGIDAGAAAAAAMLASRDGDGRFVADPFTEGTGPAQWRPTSGVNDPAAWVRNVRPFTLDSSLQFLSEGPRQLDSGAYAHEFDEVKALGSKTASRTPEQQALADFYQPNPVEMFNRAFRGLTANQGLSVADEARFYAMVNVSAADTAIHCWAEKELWASGVRSPPSTAAISTATTTPSATRPGSRSSPHRRTRSTSPATTATPAP